MSAIDKFVRKAKRATSSRFSDPFFAYVEDADGNITWLENLSDEQKHRILKRDGKS